MVRGTGFHCLWILGLDTVFQGALFMVLMTEYNCLWFQGLDADVYSFNDWMQLFMVLTTEYNCLWF